MILLDSMLVTRDSLLGVGLRFPPDRLPELKKAIMEKANLLSYPWYVILASVLLVFDLQQVKARNYQTVNNSRYRWIYSIQLNS